LKTLIKILSLVAFVAGLYLLFDKKEIVQKPGILTPHPPKHTKLTKPINWEVDEYNFEGVTLFRLDARVLSIRSYNSDDMSDFCQFDIAVGWSKMSDQKIVDKIDIKQQHRWYVWETDKFPIPRKEIENSSSNIHIIPANEYVEDIINDVCRGNIVSLRGTLVNSATTPS